MNTRPLSGSTKGFSLVEMLVALGVLSVLIVLLSQIFTTTSNVTLNLSKRLDADSQARLALDRIAYDITRMLKSTDVDYYFPATTSANGNDQMYFFSESSGYYPSTSLTPPEPTGVATTSKLDPRSTVSLVGYRVNAKTSQLERLSKGLVWSGVNGGVPIVYLPQTILGTWPDLSTDKDFQVISEGVFRLQIQYLIQSSGKSPQVSNVPNLDGINAGAKGYFNPKQVVAIIISIAILDSNSQKIVPAGTLASVASSLPSSAAPSLPSASWRQKVPLLGLPQQAASHIRIYQRFCYLNHNLSNP